ncbi:hypothetical protein ACQEU5_16980 [Marinactinospora thermotolerans]|uniref:UDP-N-acetylmuramyl pentapeptide phosphotransferase/UDP-N-acetylglucosamine-1-phosphate transferase n=1 Tax=Marinactinospora thermotolerans DSM 45154 TaxID=1122192 RepID=A0A1T4S2G0_9ACTN|nr:hypothetical protein [Marinactinospora thermotolerans]SKA21991.1 hypothetical protein SAMN02745673_03078 [Marinactinospora thermotolerans DSM 45154]
MTSPPRPSRRARIGRTVARAIAGAALGAGAARTSYAALTRSRPREDGGGVFAAAGRPGSTWIRTNFRGEQVTLLEGPALAAGTCAAALVAPGPTPRLRAATVVAAAGAGLFGAYDDLSGSGDSRGFKGHIGALARGEVTTGAVKILGIGAVGLTAAAVARPRPADLLIDGALIAGAANLVNLFDLRPGRAIKAGLLAGAPALAHPVAAAVAGPALGAAAGLLSEDLGERAMLGDAGANALGAVLGVAATAVSSRRTRLGLLAGVVALTAASEVVSFSRVIAATPPLRWADELGRRPAPGPVPAAPESPPVPEPAPQPKPA